MKATTLQFEGCPIPEFIHHVRSRTALRPELVLPRATALAVSDLRREKPDLCLEVLEIVGSWPSPEPEVRELQKQG